MHQAPEVVGPQVRRGVERLEPGAVLVLENTRWERGETRNDPDLARELASLAEAYVNDAFGAAHRAHASTAGVAEHLPSAAGLLLEREVLTLRGIVESPERPLVVVLGGAKVSDKIALIERFLDVADTLLIGGAMCFSFFRAQGKPTGDSLVEEEGVELAREALAAAEGKDCRLLLPLDLVLGDRFDAGRRAARARRHRRARRLDGPRRRPAHRRGLRARDRGRRAPCSGTARWAPSSSSRSRPARARWPRRWPTAPGTTVVGGGDSAAALAEFGLADQRRLALDRRRRGARAARGPRAARRGGARRCVGRTSPATGRCGARARRPAAYCAKLRELLPPEAERPADVGLCVPFTGPRDLRRRAARQRRSRSRPRTCTPRRPGAFTGEISPPMLVELGVDGVVLGHSERRQYYGETDRALQDKVPAALAAGLEPILCVGETEEEREAGDTERKLRHQVQEGLEQVADERLAEVVIAYEPIWAIGTGKVATPEQAQEAIAFVRALVGDRSQEAAERVRVLYGGSVKPENAAEILAQPDVDGALVGGASLEPEGFAQIVAARRMSVPPGPASRPSPRSAWWCSTAGGWPSRARATRSSWPTRPCSTSSGPPTRTRR